MGNFYLATFTPQHADIIVSALDLYVCLRLGNWGVILDHSPVKQFNVPEGESPLGDYPITDIPEEKTWRFRQRLSNLGSEYLGANFGVTLDLQDPMVPEHVRRAHALRFLFTGRESINLPESDADLLIRALDIYSRLRLGQWDKVTEHASDVEFDPKPPAESTSSLWKVEDYTKRHKYRDVLARWAAEYIAFVPNGSFGIASDAVEDDARIAYDMKEVLRHRLSWDRNPEGGWTVNFDKPMLWSKARVPLITFQRIEE